MTNRHKSPTVNILHLEVTNRHKSPAVNILHLEVTLRYRHMFCIYNIQCSVSMSCLYVTECNYLTIYILRSKPVQLFILTSNIY